MKNIKLLISRIIIYIRFLIRIIKLKITRAKNTPYIFLLNVPSHGNMGDQLIAEAEYQLLKEYKRYKIIQVTSAELWASTSLMNICISPKDILCITGGGYLGSLWPEEEFRIRSIIKKYHNNKIIIFPQTVFYDNIESDFFKTANIIYESHPELYFYTREKQSLDFTQKYLMPNKKDRVYLVPDIALTYAPKKVNDIITDKILFCLRMDKEKVNNTDSIINQIRQFIPKDIQIDYSDTQVPYSIPLRLRNSEIEKKINEFSSYKLIITDRLHGMIYATVCGVPVIALNNASGKVENVYNLWLYDFPHVFFIKKDTNIKDILEEALKSNRYNYNPQIAISHFNELNNIMR